MKTVPPEVAAVMAELNREEAMQNLAQAHLGKRVPFEPQSIGVFTSLETERFFNEKTREEETLEVVNVSPVFQSTSERLLLKQTKNEC